MSCLMDIKFCVNDVIISCDQRVRQPPRHGPYRRPEGLFSSWTYVFRILAAAFEIVHKSRSTADRVYVSLGTAGPYPGYVPAVPRET